MGVGGPPGLAANLVGGGAEANASGEEATEGVSPPVPIPWATPDFEAGPDDPLGPPGYVYCADYFQDVYFFRPTNVAYGIDGEFYFLPNRVGRVTFRGPTFGIFTVTPGSLPPEIAEAERKRRGFCQRAELVSPERSSALSAALEELSSHISGEAVLDQLELVALTNIIREHADVFGIDRARVSQARALVRDHDEKFGPLFVTPPSVFDREAEDDLGLQRAMFALQQAIFDYAYAAGNVQDFPSDFENGGFATTDYFPGPLTTPPNPSSSHQVQINASQPPIKRDTLRYYDEPARRPTGTYLPPGAVATVTVPESMLNKGYEVRVGAHSIDLYQHSTHRRFDRVSLRFPIVNIETKVANPMGGGIYIEVPYLTDGGIQTVQIDGAVRSPFFSARSFDKTTAEQWQNVERLHPAPWADFESDKVLFQVPSVWLDELEDPIALMQNWDEAMDVPSELYGYPLVRNKPVLFLQIDASNRSTNFTTGFPQSNGSYDPAMPAQRSAFNNWYLRGPQEATWVFWHEFNHVQPPARFRAENESFPNFLYVAAHNRKYGLSLEEAFKGSLRIRTPPSIDQAAIDWMVTDAFIADNIMTNIDAAYQHRGIGRYVDIVRLFGWEALTNFFKTEETFDSEGMPLERTWDDDERIIGLSRGAGVDLSPLIHFWGVPPVRPDVVRAGVAAAGLSPSRAVYDQLQRYKALAPRNNAQLLDRVAFERDGYEAWGEAEGNALQQEMERIIQLYFPDGRPPN